MFNPRALDFDGSADYLSRASDPTGNADSKTGILSCWLRIDGSNGSRMFLFSNTSTRLYLERRANHTFRFVGMTTAHVETLRIESVATKTAAIAWFHILISWNLADGSEHFYIDDADTISSITNNDNNVDWTRNDWIVCAVPGGSLKWNGAVSELYLSREYLDFSVTANRRKFISAAGKPVPLGIDGSDPTGTAPLVYMDMYPTGTNRGTGGDFTEQGSPQLIVGPGGSRKNNPALFD